MKVRLPNLVHGTRGAVLFFLIGGIVTLVLYQFTNRVHLFEPQLLRMSAIDDMFPLIPWTIWVYFTEYVIFFAAWFMLRNDLERTKYWYSYMAILLMSVTVFIFFPTTFPRADFGLDDFPSSVHVDVFRFFRANMDTPANCLPSLHVSSCYIASFAFWRISKPKFCFFFAWATLVAISTLTTKQHYFADIWTAFLLTLVSYGFFYNFVEYYRHDTVFASRRGCGSESGAIQ